MEVVVRKGTLALLILILAPGFTLAQSKPDSWKNLKELQPGQMVEVVDTQMKLFRGKFSTFTDDAIVLQQSKGEATVKRADIARVSMRDTSRRTRYMLIGAAVGVGGGLMGVLMSRSNCTAGVNCNGTGAGSYGLMAGLGGAGLAIGSIPGHYRTIYRAKKQQSNAANP
jgi:hypothetical protein